MKNSLTFGVLQQLWICFLCLALLTHFQITTSFVCHRHERFACISFCIIFISASFKARKFFFKFAAEFTLFPSAYSPSEIQKYIYIKYTSRRTIRKNRQKFIENCKSTESSFCLQNKACSFADTSTAISCLLSFC